MTKNKNVRTPINLSTDQHDSYHIPVLLHETIAGLDIKPGGTYVDATFGGGGHSAALLQQLGKNGRLVAFDQDADAVQNIPDDPRVLFIPQNFRHLKRFLRLHDIHEVDGVLADLGVSSHQFDEAERGFSIRFNADMDMRMDRRQPVTAFDILQTYTELQLHKLFEKYGEVTNARTLARTIVEVRGQVSLKTIDAFKNALRPVVKGNPNKYFAQVFQALRIEVNQELEALKELLEQAKEVVKPGGRIAVITFHSLEDRLVKQFFRDGSFEEKEENPFVQHTTEKVFRLITRKPVTAGAEELKNNSRSRSAKLRVAERV
ncbi:16S rRNA (cytosine(1402)-N(4))-methyltransferase RsmH [Niabella drilacis]|uniref:Ribosomal RNA small subunit methyltransferase H n=1 Tax=Niabella drilacis (strain DSM 25811 / CCM 8410 / CCUG 62505 / LMG 26954 / E90) TaxID=1285928 RepID=A0A1G6T2I7_NIADE|nr:16S rRNA (cytosine(1402)-N(4))-methyltransferase RsmH [Niabella drilacis]SDD22595.1 16S rRNA (cytosine1402-N4)-methyltransferase [Niabella drilacis]